MTALLLAAALAQPPALPAAPVLTANGWKAGPLPAGTWGWGGVVPAGSDPTKGFFFADFAGDKVIAIGGGANGINRTLTAAEVGWYNNCLTLPQRSATQAKPPAAPPASPAPKAALYPDCPECAALAKPQAVVAAPAAVSSSSVTTTVRVRTTIRERFETRQFTPVRSTVGVVRRVVGVPARVVRGVFGGC